MSGTNKGVWEAIKTIAAAVWNKIPSAGSRLYVALTLILPVFTSFGSSWVFYEYGIRDSRENKIKSAFIEESRSFDSVVANYVQEILAGQKPSAEATQRITDNLIRQSQFLGDATKYLPPYNTDLVADYNKALVQFQGDLPTSRSILSMRGFWEDASKIMMLRNRIIRQLQA